MPVLSTIDYVIIAVSVLICFIPALWYARRAGKNTAEFFTSGRSASWWLVGISMVATTFSTDTPNLVAGIVRTNGVSGNWVWWSFLLTGMFTVFLYAQLWRRSGVLTDLEFYELRYAGRSASIVRGFRAVYLGLIVNCLIMASVSLAACKIANVLLGWEMGKTLLICGGINIFFAATSGLWGVLVIDMIQFGIAMAGSFAAAYFALQQPQVGGLEGLLTRIDPKTLNLLPDFGDWNTTLQVLILPLAVLWWSTWYPGAEPGGGSYVAQRMLAARSERDALGGTLLFQAAHYALRPWPWILVGLASILVYPTLADIKTALPHVDPRLVNHDLAYPAMLRFLPAGWLGLMLAGLLAAYVSTMITHLNWGTSYLVHDLYRRFVRPDASERHFVVAGRVVTGLLMVLASGLTFLLESAGETFGLLLSIGAGTGLIYLLRWFWWRVNAGAEVAAMVSSFLIALALFVAAKTGHPVPDQYSALALVGSVAVTTTVWIAAMYLTPATDEATLVRFYDLIRPAGPGWSRIRALRGAGPSNDSLPMGFLGIALGLAAIYSALFGTGTWIYGRYPQAIVLTVVFVISTAGLVVLLPRLWGPGAPAAENAGRP